MAPKRGAQNPLVTAKRDRLLTVIARREQWRADLTLVRRLHADVTAAERILSGTTVEAAGLPVTNAMVRDAYAAWCDALRTRSADPTTSAPERQGLRHFLHVTTNMTPRLFHCYELANMPRTNNAMEGFIRSVKTRYRRVSGRKNWNAYLIRYGARVAFYEARARTGELGGLGAEMRHVPRTDWRNGRRAQQQRQQEQLKQHRVRHRRDAYLADLEAQWASLEPRT